MWLVGMLVQGMEKQVHQALAAVALYMPIAEGDMTTHLVGHMPNHLTHNGERKQKSCDVMECPAGESNCTDASNASGQKAYLSFVAILDGQGCRQTACVE